MPPAWRGAQSQTISFVIPLHLLHTEAQARTLRRSGNRRLDSPTRRIISPSSSGGNFSTNAHTRPSQSGISPYSHEGTSESSREGDGDGIQLRAQSPNPIATSLLRICANLLLLRRISFLQANTNPKPRHAMDSIGVAAMNFGGWEWRRKNQCEMQTQTQTQNAGHGREILPRKKWTQKAPIEGRGCDGSSYDRQMP